VTNSPTTDLRILDSSGREVSIRDASIDYGGFFSLDKHTDGIRVLQGAGTATLMWSNVDTVCS